MRPRTAERLADLASRAAAELRGEAVSLSGRLGALEEAVERARQREAAGLEAAVQADARLVGVLGMVAEGARMRQAGLAREQACVRERLAPLAERLRELRGEEKRWREIAARIRRREAHERGRRRERELEDLAALRRLCGEGRPP